MASRPLKAKAWLQGLHHCPNVLQGNNLETGAANNFTSQMSNQRCQSSEDIHANTHVADKVLSCN